VLWAVKCVPTIGAMGEARVFATGTPWPRRRRRRGLRALPLRLLALSSLAVVVAAIGAVVREYRARRPTVERVAALAERLPRTAAPTPMSGVPGVLNSAVDTLAFPDWSGFGWRPVGVRSDELAGRSAMTVTYARGGHRLTYTIVSGTRHVAHPTPTWTTYRRAQRGPKVELNFVPNDRGGLTLTFKRRLRTVVMTTPGDAATSRPAMVRLAVWAAGGRLLF
jgi:hypothetical protein